MLVALLGYMGSGKSAVGKILAQRLKLPFTDLDDLIEEREGKSIAALFDEKGALFFRHREREHLEQYLKTVTSGILATGGGTPCYFDNMELISKYAAASFYLEASVTELVSRLHGQQEQRPLIAGFSKDKLSEFIGKHLFERLPYYKKTGHNISTDNCTPDQVADQIINNLP